MLTWHYVTSTEYNAASADVKTADKLYFLSDTHQIYRGTELFTEACTLVESLPATPAVGRLYVLSSTLEGKIYNGTAWQTVIQPVQAAVDVADTAKPVSGKAVADYVSGAIADVTAGANNAFAAVSYDDATHVLTFTSTDGQTTKTVDIGDMPIDLAYDSASGLLTLKDETGAQIGTGINLDLERFVKSGSYDPETQKITLVFNDEQSIEIDASALVDVYTGDATATASVAVSADNKITATVKVSAEADNILSAKGDGLYVAPTDLSAYATDAEVEAIRATLQGNIDTVAGDLATEAQRAKDAEAALTTALGEEVTRAKAAEEAAAAAAAAAQKAADDEAARAKGVEGELDTAVKAAQKAADDEAARAKGVEGELDTAVKAAQAAAEAAQKAADDEKTRAEGKEGELLAAIEAEKSRAEGKEGELLTAIGEEKSRAEAAEKANADAIDAIEAVLEWKTSV